MENTAYEENEALQDMEQTRADRHSLINCYKLGSEMAMQKNENPSLKSMKEILFWQSSAADWTRSQ